MCFSSVTDFPSGYRTAVAKTLVFDLALFILWICHATLETSCLFQI